MISKCSAIGIVGALVLAANVTSAEAIYTSGMVNCAQWVEHRTQRTAKIFEAFLQGTMNGLAMGSGTEFWNASGSILSADQVYLWMDKFCRENPLNDVVTGAVTLMNEHTGGAYKRSHD